LRFLSEHRRSRRETKDDQGPDRSPETKGATPQQPSPEPCPPAPAAGSKARGRSRLPVPARRPPESSSASGPVRAPIRSHLPKPAGWRVAELAAQVPRSEFVLASRDDLPDRGPQV